MSPLNDTLVALGAGVAIAVAVSCGGARSSMPTSPSMEHAPAGESRNARIEQLDREINEAFAKLEVGPRPPPPSLPTMSGSDALPASAGAGVKFRKEDPTCRPGAAQTCTDICELADSICKNAKSICEIAAELGGDAWAAEKCSSGQTSCETANSKCCGCS